LTSTDGPRDEAESTRGREPLFLVHGEATAEEVAALTVVLQSVAAASAPGEDGAVTPEWSAPRRRLRRTLPAGPGGWRSSGLPR
jgi:hypothetical protein